MERALLKLMGRYAILLFLALGVVRPAAWAVDAGGEGRHKAAIIYNILSFVQWPEAGSRRTTFNLCIPDGDEVGAALSILEGENLGGRAIRVQREAAVRAGNCDAVYLTPASLSLARQFGSGAVLTIASAHGMVDQGVMVNLVQDGRRIGFDIGVGAMRRAQLSVSAKLLRLARYVRED